MNDQPYYSRGVVMAAAAWLATTLLLLMAWAAWILGEEKHIYFAILVAETACVLSAVAAVLHLRCYAARICRLVRVTGELQRRRDDSDVTRFNPRR